MRRTRETVAACFAQHERQEATAPNPLYDTPLAARMNVLCDGELFRDSRRASIAFYWDRPEYVSNTAFCREKAI